MESIELKKKRGQDDLLSLVAFKGNSQGDEFATNDVKEANAYGNWCSYRFDDDVDRNDQESINKEVERRRKWNEEYIQKLKDEGRYLEEYTTTIHFKSNPIFDVPTVTSGDDLPYKNMKIFFPEPKK